MVTNQFTWKIGGPAGYGIKSVGAMFGKAMLRCGLHVFTYDEYPSLIRGGHNAMEVAVDGERVFAPRRPVNVLVALDRLTVDEHRHELSADAAVVYDPNVVTVAAAEVPAGARLLGVPLEEIVTQAGGERVMVNTVALGASFALLDIPFEILKALIENTFKGKPAAIVTKNTDIARAGYDYLRQHFGHDFSYKVKPRQDNGHLLMTGNEALAWGAVQAGCKLYAGYPMTPSTSILHTMAELAKQYNIVVKHTEDEISAINTVAGAGYAGVRAMTATAGGGFSLMVETLGLAAMVEIPLVIVEGMRPGPSTGLPTWTSQGDLKFVLNASQDEFPRFVLAPGDVEQCFNFIQEAFNLAEKYQTPVIVMTDKHLAECYQSFDQFDFDKAAIERGEVLTEQLLVAVPDYRRYADTASGVSPRALPGTRGGVHLANSDEHDERGFTTEEATERVKMMEKRFRKEAAAIAEIQEPVVVGDRHADLTLVSWGSTKGSIREAMAVLQQAGHKVNYLQVTHLSPFPVKKVKEVFRQAKKVAIVENNKTGQLAGWLREQTGLSPDYKILKYDGRPFFVHELVESIQELL